MSSFTRWFRDVIRWSQSRHVDEVMAEVQVNVPKPPFVAPLEDLFAPVQPRCSSRKREGSRSWRCARNAGHGVAMSGTRRTLGHVDTSGRRHW